MEQSTVTLIVGLAGIAGTFGSGFAAQYMARRSQREAWLLDHRKEEWKELLATLARSFATICQIEPLGVQTGEDRRTLDEAKTIAQVTLKDRILIAKEVEELRLFRLWYDAAIKLDDDHFLIPFAETFAVIRDKIIEAARKEVELKSCSLDILKRIGKYIDAAGDL